MAVLINAALKITNQAVLFVFYIDEEYEFQGLKAFINKYQNLLQPQLICSLDGSDLKITNSCRGIFEITFGLTGKSGHAAIPKLGNNAILAAGNILYQLNKILKLPPNRDSLGQTTFNAARINGGIISDLKGKTIIFSSNFNSIANYCEMSVEFRVNNILTSMKLLNILKYLAQKFKVKLTLKRVLSNYIPWYTPRSELNDMVNLLKKNSLPVIYENPAVDGYLDIALLAETLNCTCFCIGAKGANCHDVNEWVDVKSLKILGNLMNTFILQK